MVRQRFFCGCFAGFLPSPQGDDHEEVLTHKCLDLHKLSSSPASDVQEPVEFQGYGQQLVAPKQLQRSKWGCPCRSRAIPNAPRGGPNKVAAKNNKREPAPFGFATPQNAVLVAEWKIVAMSLTEDEYENLQEFFALVEQLGLHNHPSNTAEQPHARKASTLLRFLRARGGDVQKAASLLREALDWRREFDLDRKLKAWREEMAQGTSARARLLLKYGYIAKLGTDVVGHPVYVQRFSQADIGGLVRELGDEAILLHLLCMIEDSFEEANKQMLRSGRFVGGFVEVIDVGNDGIVAGWYQRAMAAIGPYRKFAPVFDKVYPERVRVAFILRAPKAFALIWRLALPFVPESTRGKIRIKGQASRTWVDELSEFLPMESVPCWLKDDDPSHLSAATPVGGFVPKGAFAELQH